MDENQTSNRNQHLRWIAATLIGTYVLVRVVGYPLFWRFVSEYFAITFEIAFVTIAYFLFQQQIVIWRIPSGKHIAITLLMFFAGLLVYQMAALIRVPIPFDLFSYQTVFQLLFLAPILEEAIFRMALWQALVVFLKKGWLVVLMTTALFAAGHLAAYWFVPAEFRGFIVYQSLYVFFLGSVAGWQRLSANAVGPAVLVHFGFNFGFFIAAKIFS